MAFRFFKRVRIAPGLTVNLSKSGGSLSFGPRGGKLTVGPRGVRTTAGLSGTGLFYTKQTGWSSGGRGAGTATRGTSPVPAGDKLTLGFFQRLTTPANEKNFVDGLKALTAGQEAKALNLLRQAPDIADAAFIAGFTALKRGLYDDALMLLLAACEKHQALGRRLKKYGVALTLQLPITDEVMVLVESDLRGVLLGLAELYQIKKDYSQAMKALHALRRRWPDDVVVKVSLAELALDAPHDRRVCEQIVQMAGGNSNETPVHTVLMLYKARALRELTLYTAARETLTFALRRKKDRSAELLRALRYERALVYEAMGQAGRARAEFEKLYAEAPDYEDVGERLRP